MIWTSEGFVICTSVQLWKPWSQGLIWCLLDTEPASHLQQNRDNAQTLQGRGEAEGKSRSRATSRGWEDVWAHLLGQPGQSHWQPHEGYTVPSDCWEELASVYKLDKSLGFLSVKDSEKLFFGRPLLKQPGCCAMATGSSLQYRVDLFISETSDHEIRYRKWYPH